MTNFSGSAVRKNLTRTAFGTLIAGAALALVPVAHAAPAAGCSASEISGTVGSVTTAAQVYLDGHPGANQAVSAAMKITALKPMVCQMLEPINRVRNHSGREVNRVSLPPALVTRLFTTPFAAKKTDIMLTTTTFDIK